MSASGPAARPSAPVPSPAPYDEALWFGPVGWLGIVGFALTLWAALLPVDLRLATTAAVVVTVVALVLAVRWTPRVRVAAGELRAGAAHIPVELLRTPRALAGDELRAELGPRLDARAYVCLRGWVRTGVRAEVDDPQDPTPYWIVSTRRPDELVAALERARHER